MSKCRALFVVPSLRRAGAENQIVQLVNGLPVERIEKHLLSYLPEDELLASVDQETVHYHSALRRSKFDLSVAREIGQVIDKHHIDIVHCTLEHALLFGLLGSRYAQRNPVVVCAIHTTALTDLKHKVADALLYRHLLKRCREVWFMCRMQSDLWVERMPFLAGKNRIIYNGVKTDEFEPASWNEAGAELLRTLEVSPEAKTVCCVAGFRPEKYHHILLRAFKNLVGNRQDDVVLLLAGSGPEEAALRQLTSDLNLGSQVIFTGELADVRPLLAIAHCKVLASAAETFSMAMLEAMAMEVPVISTRVGGASEAIADRKSGVLISPGNVDELADAMDWVLSDESRRIDLASAARQTVVDNFSYTSMVEKSHEHLVGVAQLQG